MKRLDEIFDVWYGVNLELVNCEQIENGIPFVSRQSVNNGISGYVKSIDILPNPAHSLSIAGSGSVLSTFYHDYEYYSGRDVYIAKPKQNLSKEQMLYYAYVIENNKYRFNYGRQANKTLKSILIPDILEIPKFVNQISVSDYKFEQEPILNKKIELHTENWKWFRYDDIFEIRKGKRLTKAEQIDGDVPYISSSSVNNAVDNYINNGYTDENCISFACYGSIGEVFYQAGKVWISDNANSIYLKDKELNKYIAFFLLTLLYKEIYRFSYGMTAKKERLRNFTIKLPATLDSIPDWQFMEDYIKSLPYSKSI
jgi:restriction endonuclease S subunit